MTGLVSAAELLPDDDLGRLVRGQVTRLRRLVEDLLEISRLDAASLEIAWQDCDLGDIVRSALELYSDRVEIDVSRAGMVRVEPRRVDRIVTNLVRNALNYGAPPVRVDVVGTCVRVQDSGPGYPPELLRDGPRRFATFTVGKGSGLGLTIAAKHSEAMGGRLELGDVEGPGSGARADVHFQPAAGP